MTEDISHFLSGEKLYGDDFDERQILQWFNDEAEGYASLGAGDRRTYQYEYHALNTLHGYRHLPQRRFHCALGLGSAYGDEFQPIAHRIDQIRILDPSDAFAVARDVFGVPVEYHKPDQLGHLKFPDQSFDLITCFGVLHHIPNVTHVVRECFRCLQCDGALLLREPIVSMGDWRQPRPGLTRRERGIPLGLLDDMVRAAGFRTLRRSLCDFAPLGKLARSVGVSTARSVPLTTLDAIFSMLFAWNQRYHATNLLRRLAPTSVFYVLTRPPSADRTRS